MEKRLALEMRGKLASEIDELNLDNCRSTSIMGLTDEFTNLVSLSLINVGLTTLKGFPKLPNLKKLELSDNRISNGLNYLANSTKLSNLNLSGNKIKDLDELKPLEAFKNLVVLDLFNNEATQTANYRGIVFEMIPSLKYLDGYDSNDIEATSEEEDIAPESEDDLSETVAEDEDVDEDSVDDDEEDDGVLLADVYNENLEEDSSDWNEEEDVEDFDDDDDQFDETDDGEDGAANTTNESTPSKKGDSATAAKPAAAAADKTDDKDDDKSEEGDDAPKGKKRKHE